MAKYAVGELEQELYWHFVVCGESGVNPYAGCTNGPGYVYFLRAENGLTKIGETNDLAARLKRHRRKWTGNHTFRLLWVVESNHRLRLETRLHLRFDKQRAGRGDWFSLSDDDMRALVAEYPSRYAEVNRLGGVL